MNTTKTIFQYAGCGLLASLLVGPGAALAQSAPSYECDGTYGACGTPDFSGGGGCGCGGGAILIANTDLGDTYQSADDFDDDGIEDDLDNCGFFHNPGQEDGDGDSHGDACDNCRALSNQPQADADGDAQGDVCDTDLDGDSILNAVDNCREVPNPLTSGAQPDLDRDEMGDACDPDIDGDGRDNLSDDCPLIAGSHGAQDVCFPDTDGDGIDDIHDRCRAHFDPAQSDIDTDGVGDACDSDKDGDGFLNHADLCQAVSERVQVDVDRDGLGDACDPSFCYVVYGDKANCLDPADVLDVYAPNLLVGSGQEMRLPFFVNRNNAQRLQFEWTVLEAPAGSSAAVRGPAGETTLSNHEAVYDVAGRPASFRPDAEGSYRLQVNVSTVGADPVTREVGASASHIVTIVADGGSAGGCSVSTGSSNASSALWLALAAVLPLIRRRRRSS